MSVTTFRDFTFRARHSMSGRSDAAAHLHWHTYVVRFWFVGSPDQDELSLTIERRLLSLHGSVLTIEPDSSDESLAAYLLETANAHFGKCVKVRVTNDGQRGAEASA